MRFPLALTLKIAQHIIKHKLKRTPKFAMVLQLEPLHTCNLTCTGCGRIREYSTSLKDMVPLERCLGAAEECEAPMVSICGGEPLIYPKIRKRGVESQWFDPLLVRVGGLLPLISPQRMHRLDGPGCAEWPEWGVYAMAATTNEVSLAF